MDSLLSDIFAQLIAISSFLLVGTAILKLFSPEISGIKLIAYSTGIGVVFFSFLGLMLPSLSSLFLSTLGVVDRKTAIFFLVLVNVIAFLYLLIRRKVLVMFYC